MSGTWSARSSETAQEHVALCVLAVLAAVAVVVQDSSPSVLLLATMAALPWILLAVSVRVPCGVTVVVTIAAVAALLVEQSVTGPIAPIFLVLVVAVTAAAQSMRYSTCVLAASIAAVVVIDRTGHFDASIVWLLGLGLGWLGGIALQLQRMAQQAEAERFATEERERIARELHDVVAHSLAVTMLHVTGARLLVHRDPDAAEAALRQAEESGRRSMSDIRRAIGVAGGTEDGPMPSAADVNGLVEDFVSAGLPVTLDVEGDLTAIPTSTGLALYRIAEESMSNVAKHATGSSSAVRIVATDDCVTLIVQSHGSPAPSRSGGRGLVGMTERAELVGGSVTAGPVADGWRVVAELPVAAP